jgi:hypothetical protein
MEHYEFPTGTASETTSQTMSLSHRKCILIGPISMCSRSNGRPVNFILTHVRKNQLRRFVQRLECGWADASDYR